MSALDHKEPRAQCFSLYNSFLNFILFIQFLFQFFIFLFFIFYFFIFYFLFFIFLFFILLFFLRQAVFFSCY